jgi:hypothetical protein
MLRRVRRWAIGAALCLLTLLLALMAAPTASADTTAPATVSFVQTGPITVKLSQNKLDPSQEFRATLYLAIKNDGPQDVTKYSFLPLLETTPKPGDLGITMSQLPTLKAFHVTEVSIDISVTNQTTSDIGISLEVEQPAQVKAATLTLVLKRLPTSTSYWVSIWFALGLTVAFWVAGLVRFRGRLRKDIRTEKAWSFSGSVVTTLSLAGVVLTGVLASTSFLDEVFPGIDTGRMAGLSFLFAGTIAAAAIVFGIGARRPAEDDTTGTPVFFLLSSVSFVLFGVTGQLCLLGVFTYLSDSTTPVKGFVFACLAITCS